MGRKGDTDIMIILISELQDHMKTCTHLLTIAVLQIFCCKLCGEKLLTKRNSPSVKRIQYFLCDFMVYEILLLTK